MVFSVIVGNVFGGDGFEELADGGFVLLFEEEVKVVGHETEAG